MRIAIVGPTYPYKGGIALHTTQLAHRLTAAGHDVSIISWRAQYPFFYPGKQFVPGNRPEIPRHSGATRALSWKNPASWAVWGRRLRKYDQVIFVWTVPTFQGPVYLGMLQALGSKKPIITVICHNVLPHEPRPGDKHLTRNFLQRADHIITHTQAQATLAATLTPAPVSIVPLPLSILEITKQAAKKGTIKRQLLFFGMIRPYKGVDVLLKAIARVPDVQLVIAGEFWGGTKAYRELIKELGLTSRVTILAGYIESDELARLIAKTDAVVLPYRSGTASWNVSLAHAYGTPVIATTAGSLGSQVNEAIDGLLCKPDNVASLTKAIKHFYEPGIAQQLRAGVPALTAEDDWQVYVQTVIGD